MAAAALGAAPLLDDDEIDSGLIAASAPVAPTFHLSWYRDTLALSGHTMSIKHEQALLQALDSSFPGKSFNTDFSPLGVTPEYWPDMTLIALHSLAETVSSDVRITPGGLTIRAVTAAAPTWQNRLDTLRESLPEGVLLSADTIVVDAVVNTVEVCESAFEAFDSGPISFKESTTELRSSAYPRLDRVVALASACNPHTIAIIGHSDASGPESWNQALSLARAAAVADYLELGGIPRTRLHALGRGSTTPIADNATRYGRGLNRRIEIEWQNPAR